MELGLRPGRYVVAVSGGVDSMALLDMLARTAGSQGLELVVAHFEHGIRPDSDADREFVQAAAARYGLPFVCEHGRLGADASEATAREARYAFLRRIRAERGAQAIITAHHQDDVLETAIINMVRGTGPKGLSALASHQDMLRPLLGLPKAELLAYARTHGLQWREDSTNEEDRYLRNYIRHHIMPRLDAAKRRQLLGHIQASARLSTAIDAALAPHTRGPSLARGWFIQLPYDISCAAMAAWLRQHGVRFNRNTIHRLVIFGKTARPGKRANIQAGWYLEAARGRLILKKPEHQDTTAGNSTV